MGRAASVLGAPPLAAPGALPEVDPVAGSASKVCCGVTKTGSGMAELAVCGEAADVAAGAAVAKGLTDTVGGAATTAVGTVNCENAARVVRVMPDPVGILTLPKLPLVEP